MSETRTSTVIVGYGRLAEHLGWLFGRSSDLAYVTESGESNGRTLTVAGDIRSGASMATAFEQLDSQLSPWANIIYLAKKSTRGRWSETPSTEIMDDVDAIAGGAVRTLQAATNHMRRVRPATITLVGGDFGRHPNPLYPGYSMGKAALENLTESLVNDPNTQDAGLRVLGPVIHGSFGTDIGHIAAAQEIYDRISQGRQSGTFDVARHDPSLQRVYYD